MGFSHAVVLALSVSSCVAFAPVTRWSGGALRQPSTAVAAKKGAPEKKVEKKATELEFIELKHSSGASSKVYLFGGDVTSYIDADGTEWIANRPDAKWDGSKPISGGLSHCFPQFGPDTKQLKCARDVQQHGFARNLPWAVADKSADSVTLTLEPSDYTKAMFPFAFKCTFTVTVTDTSLDTSLVVANTGKDEFDFQAALHSYYDVSDISKASVARDGDTFNGNIYTDRMLTEENVREKSRARHPVLIETREELTIDKETDSLYPGVGNAVLKDSGKGKALKIVNGGGFKDMVLWSPYGDEAMGASGFLCVESAALDAVPLAPGAEWSASLSLEPTV